MGNRLKYLMKNTSIFAIGELGTKLINFFLVPFYTHILTTEEYGTVDLIFTLSTLITPLVIFNIGEAIMRYALDEDAQQDKVFTIGLFSIICGVFVSLLIIPVASHVELIKPYVIYMFVYITICATKTVLTSYLRGREKLKLYVSCNLLNTFFIAVFNIFFLAFFKSGIKGYLTAYILAESVAVVFAFFSGKMHHQLKNLILDISLAKKMILFSLAVIPNSLMWWIINSSDRVMVTALNGVSENGLLAVSYKLPSLLTMVNTILMQAWKYSAIKERNSIDREEFTNKMLDQFLRGSILVSAGMLLLIKPVTKVLFAEMYFLSWKSSSILLIGYVVMGISTFVGTVYYVEKDMIGNMISAIVGAIVNLGLNYLMIPGIGASGATLASTISYLVILIYRYFDTKKYQRIDVFNLKYILITISLCLMCLGNFMDNMTGTLILIGAFLACLLQNVSYIRSNFMRVYGMIGKLTGERRK